MVLDTVAIAGICSAIVAACQLFGTISTNRRIRLVHTCLHEVAQENRVLHTETQTKVVAAAVTDDARDIRNEGGKAIVSGVKPDATG